MSAEIIAQPSPQLVNDVVHISTSKWLWGLVFIGVSGAARSQQNLLLIHKACDCVGLLTIFKYLRSFTISDFIHKVRLIFI